MLLQIEQRETESGIVVVELAGRMALGRESQRLESLVGELGAANKSRVVLDMTRVEYLDSAGIGLIALAAGKLKESGGRLVVVAAPGRVLSLLELTQVNLIVPVCGTVEEARRIFDDKQSASA